MLLQRKNDSRDASSKSLTDTAPAGDLRRRLAEHELRAGQDGPQRRARCRRRTCPRCRPVSIERRAGDPSRRCVTGRRYARRASVGRESSARSAASSALGRRGRQTKIRRRLGVSPGPVALNGPVIVRLVDVRQARCDRSRSSVAAQERLQAVRAALRAGASDRNDAPTTCGPALTARARSRASSARDHVGRRCRATRALSAFPPIGARCTRSPSTRISSCRAAREAADDAEVRLEQLHLEHVLAVERERVAHHERRRACRAAAFDVRVCDASPRTTIGLGARAEERRVADRQRADLSPPPRDSARAAPARRRARRRCCRSPRSSRRAAAATPRRRRAPAGRGPRWRTRRGSGGAAPARPACARRRRVERASRATRPARRRPPRPAAAAPAGGIAPVRSLRTTFSQISAWAGALSMSRLARSRPAVMVRAL